MIEALIGGSLALLGGWLGIRWQSGHSAKALARSLLAEIEAGFLLDEQGHAEQLYRDMLASLREHGEVGNPDAVKRLFDIDPAEAAPVYYASVGNLGVLPADLARALVLYHTLSTALLRVVVRFLGPGIELEQDQVRGLAASIEQSYDQLLDRRDSVVAALHAYLGTKPVISPPQRKKALPLREVAE